MFLLYQTVFWPNRPTLFLSSDWMPWMHNWSQTESTIAHPSCYLYLTISPYPGSNLQRDGGLFPLTWREAAVGWILKRPNEACTCRDDIRITCIVQERGVFLWASRCLISDSDIGPFRGHEALASERDLGFNGWLSGTLSCHDYLECVRLRPSLTPATNSNSESGTIPRTIRF